jgi:acyl carrier protein
VGCFGTGTKFKMHDAKNRLNKCFTGAFSSLPPASFTVADTTNVEAWDSVASVTLFALIEEEFGIELDIQALGQLNSYQKILEYLEVRTEQTA